MRCPHCAGQIPDASRFCGICGRPTIEPEAREGGDSGARPHGRRGTSMADARAASVSLFELPVSKNARIARVALVLALDAVLVVAGVAMIVSYLNTRSRAQRPGKGTEQATPLVEVLPPTPVVPPPASAAADGAAGEKGREASDDSAPDPAPDPRIKARTSSDERVRPSGRGGGQARPVAAPDPAPATDTGTAGVPSPTEDDPPSPGESEPAGEPGTAEAEPPAGTGAPPSPEDIRILANQIELVVRRNGGQLERCYKQASKTAAIDEPLAGTIKVQFEITATGQAQNARAVGNTTGSEQLARCVVAVLGSWTFPIPPGGEPLGWEWPFRFGASK